MRLNRRTQRWYRRLGPAERDRPSQRDLKLGRLPELDPVAVRIGHPAEPSNPG